VRLLVSRWNVEVLTTTRKILPSQVNLVWAHDGNVMSDRFELVFAPSVPAVGLASFSIRFVSEVAAKTDFQPVWRLGETAVNLFSGAVMNMVIGVRGKIKLWVNQKNVRNILSKFHVFGLLMIAFLYFLFNMLQSS